ncbi:CPBP family intramembrane glutamic endopeptidase [Aestuariivivens sp. NBU2969]|uniref:CPBP family intramembrane glutamic endopeptidase n=1 Tax=Aestuariivivens sp. NBU2969 TaxID=2873267 RepID=UPI001CBC088E|nr:CPBP family intramembrane glutamic endopeptidase [Aestuariivivens sp. NBU2969]
MKALTTEWVLIVICFVTYFVISMVYKRLAVHNLKSALTTTNGLRFLNLKHLLGIVLFGMLSYTMIPELNYLVDTIQVPRIPLLLIFVFIFMLSAYVSYLSISKQFEEDIVGCADYGFVHAWFYFLIRFTFLLGYEFFFRGVLLFKFLEFTTLPMAIFYATILYVVIHSFDSKKEVLGAIPFGVVLCLFAYYTNSIWYPFLIHLSLSAVYECYLFYHLTLKNNILS